MINNRKIPVAKRITGLHIYCNSCKNRNSKELKPTNNCKHPFEKLSYKAVFTVPGTKSSTRQKAFTTDDIDEAIKQTLEFKKSLIDNNYNEPPKHEETLPLDLIGCIAMYIDYLTNNNVYDHQIKPRSEEHVKSVVRYLEKFIESLKSNNINIKSILIDQIDDVHVEMFTKYINKDNPMNRTYNRQLDTLREFFDYLIIIKHYKLYNYFVPKNAKRLSTKTDIRTISSTEFFELLDVILPENSIEILKTGERKYHYFDWLKDALKLALYTGLRRDGVITMKFSDVIEINGKPTLIKAEDFKYNRRFNLTTTEEKKYIFLPIFKNLKELLFDFGYEDNKGAEKYIIDPDSKRNRQTMKDDLSKAFSHFWKKTNSKEELEFRHLRKTYITRLNNFTGGRADSITGHSGQEVILKYYQDPRVVDPVIENFSM